MGQDLKCREELFTVFVDECTVKVKVVLREKIFFMNFLKKKENI